MGHGNGREFLKGDEIMRLYCQAVALIMGCSSGKLIVSTLSFQPYCSLLFYCKCKCNEMIF